ncbi:hypothetical protein Ahy_B02g059731 [Arachis hypogaea]|uniref:Uncharacterized protein n=1 Tax=Arachis hypogaea TaxID=3818 RepID=A0A445AH33_ARAHY|nr:hypothetical protein Ahy_B02g059731 [Arachis hypogaea]
MTKTTTSNQAIHPFPHNARWKSSGSETEPRSSVQGPVWRRRKMRLMVGDGGSDDGVGEGGVSDSKKKRGLLGFIDSISINAIFSSSSSVVSLVRLFSPPQHASDAAAPCVCRRSSQTRRNELSEVEESVKVLKDVAKTRKVAAEKVLSVLSVIEKAKIDPSGFLETLGGNESPGRT